ncbi:hypothetical protein SS50377_28325 [Spironucleus salmonicida]|uniref:Uncharacterized protein n=1 Tax=Spironucleus salmonicida TaxID=348837 RepID=V6LUH1_9EUKA|nr:hypothetical protein SS50377_28325 [Spironucleus salmonicida]|eukprot:EST47356.1 Hypothetical protein SS50377_12564 [Spironucleus salmonicida]
MDRRQQRIQKIVDALIQENISSGQSQDDFENINIVQSSESSEKSNSSISLQDEENFYEDQDKLIVVQEKKSQLKRNRNYVDPALINKPVDITEIIKNPQILLSQKQKQTQNQSNVTQSQIMTQHTQQQLIHTCKISNNKVFQNAEPTMLSASYSQQEHTTQSVTDQQTTNLTPFKLDNQAWTQHLAVTHAWNTMAYKQSTIKTQVQIQENQQINTNNQQQSVISIFSDSRNRAFLSYLEVVLNSELLARFVVENYQKQTNSDDFYRLNLSKQLPDEFDYRRGMEAFYRNQEVSNGVKQAVFEGKRQEKDNNIIVQRSAINMNFDSQSIQNDCEKSINTGISMNQEQGGNQTFSGIINVKFEPAKRGFLNKFYQLAGTPPVPVPGVLSVQQQTDLQLKVVKNQKKQNFDDTVTFIIIDQTDHDLSLFSFQELIKKISVCTTLKIVRGRGRAGRKLFDVLEKVKEIRPDLLEEDIFMQQKIKYESGVSYKASLQGVYQTIQGVYDDKLVGDLEVVDNAVQDFRILDKDIIDFQFANECENWSHRWFPWSEKPIKTGFKYTDPATNQGYNTVHEFKIIREQQMEDQQKKLQKFLVNNDVNTIQLLINENKFKEANQCYQRQLQNVTPQYLCLNQVTEENLDIVQKILGPYRYKVLD